MSILNIIKSTPLFYELYDEEIEEIVAQCRVMNVLAGDKIVEEGEEGDELFILLVGEAHVERKGCRLATIHKGELFGEMVLMNERVRLADIVATSTSDVLVVNYQDIFKFFKDDPKIFSILILNLSRMLAKRLKNAGSDIGDLHLKIKKLKKENES